MGPRKNRFPLLVLTLAVLCGICPSARRAMARENPAEDGYAIMLKVKERADEVAKMGGKSQYTFNKVSIAEELDSDGQVKSQHKKTYEVTQIGGRPFQHVVKINDKSLSEQERKTQDQKEKAARERFEGAKAGADDRRNISPWMGKDLLDRFVYEVLRVEKLNGRPAWVIAFKPKSADLPVKQNADRVLNKLSGLVWVDQEEYELAKLDVALSEKVTLWGGLLGNLEQLTLTIFRSRVEAGGWVTKTSAFTAIGRKLLSRIHVRTYEEASDIRKAAASEGTPKVR